MSKQKESRATTDLFEFENLTLNDAVELLKALMFQRPPFLGKGLKLCFDPESQEVFLVDNKGHVGELKQWATCKHCGAQGFIDSTVTRFVDDSICMACCLLDE